LFVWGTEAPPLKGFALVSGVKSIL
jgi:hypothetical protein